MTVAIGMGLFGECRTAGKCICGLCSSIEYGSHAGRPRLPDITKPGCEHCGALRLRKNHNCPALRPPKPPKVKKERQPRQPVQLHGAPTEPQKCGCILWRGRRVKWCYKAHTPTSHPNQCQHAATIIQNFGTPAQKRACVGCSNDISE